MNQLNIISFQEIWTEIKKFYDPTFIETLLEIPDLHVYAFGGIVTDTSMGKPWKDLDIRVIWNIPEKERNEKVLSILEKYTTIVQKVEFPNGLVVRVKIPSGKDMIIDVGVNSDFEKFRADFKACAIFVDLRNGEIVELSESCVDDFKNRTIRALDEPNEQLENDPSHLFRALKFAEKTGFIIDPEFEKILKNKKHLVQKVINDVISYLKNNGKDSFAEYFLGNIFGGLKSDAVTYIKLLEDYGFLEEMCKTIQQPVCSDDSIKIVMTNNSEKFNKKVTLEDKISLLLSIISKTISSKPSVCFESIKKSFGLDIDRSDGNEFPIDPNKIIFLV